MSPKARLLTMAGAMVAVTCALSASASAQTAACKIGSVPVPGLATKTLGPKAFNALHAAVRPGGAGERWTEIGWQPDLVAARRTAAREGKPMLLWIMDGHPLGCT